MAKPCHGMMTFRRPIFGNLGFRDFYSYYYTTFFLCSYKKEVVDFVLGNSSIFFAKLFYFEEVIQFILFEEFFTN